MFSTYIAGVSFSENICQIAVIEKKRRGPRLRFLQEFRKSSDGPAWFLKPLASRSEKLFKKVKRVGVAIDHERLGFYHIPVDSALERSAVPDHLAWEFSNYVLEGKAGDFVNDTHLLPGRQGESTVDALIVAVPREYVKGVQGEILQSRFACGTIDAGFFAAEHLALASHPELRTGQNAIVGVFPRHVTIGVLAAGRLVRFVSKNIESHIDLLAMLQGALTDWPAGTLCIYGTAAAAPLLAKIRSVLQANVVMLNSFKAIELGLEHGASQLFLGREHVFAQAIGIALKES